MGYFTDEEDQYRYYEPSQIDEILNEYKEKMKDALISSVKEDIETLKRTNEALYIENKSLKDDKERVLMLERSVKYEKDNLLKTVKKERLGELMKDFNLVMYKVYNIGKKEPKCEKCDKDRKIRFTTPSGNKMTEDCKCNKDINYYAPEIYECSEFKMNEYNNKISVWYERKECDNREYYNRCGGEMAEKIYNETMIYENLIYYKTYFKTEEECQKYCEWLNKTINDGE
jgi:hypothetical protein